MGYADLTDQNHQDGNAQFYAIDVCAGQGPAGLMYPAVDVYHLQCLIVAVPGLYLALPTLFHRKERNASKLPRAQSHSRVGIVCERSDGPSRGLLAYSLPTHVPSGAQWVGRRGLQTYSLPTLTAMGTLPTSV